MSEVSSLADILPEKVQLGDKEVPRDEVIKIVEQGQQSATAMALQQAELKGLKETNQNLQHRLSESDGRLSELSGQVQLLSQTQQQEPPAQARDYAQERAELDEADPDYPVKLQELYREEMRLQRDELEKKLNAQVEEVNRVVDTKINQTRDEQLVQDHNSTILSEVLGDKDKVPVELSKAERNAVEKQMNSLYSVDGEYGRLDPNTQRFVYNTNAVEKAIRLVDSIQSKIDNFKAAEHRNEGLRGRALGEAATRGLPHGAAEGAGAMPADGDLEGQASVFSQMSEQGRIDFLRKNPNFQGRLKEAFEGGQLKADPSRRLAG